MRKVLLASLAMLLVGCGNQVADEQVGWSEMTEAHRREAAFSGQLMDEGATAAMQREYDVDYRSRDVDPKLHEKVHYATTLLASQYVADNFSGEKRLDRLGRQGLPVADYVVEVRHHPRFHVRAAVARLMGRFGTPHHMQYLIPMLNDPDLIVRQKASIGLKRLARAYYGIDAHAHDLREAEIDHLGSNDAALSGAEVEALRRRDETLKIMLQFNPRTEDIAVRQRTQEAWRTFLQSAR